MNFPVEAPDTHIDEKDLDKDDGGKLDEIFATVALDNSTTINDSV